MITAVGSDVDAARIGERAVRVPTLPDGGLSR